MARIADLRPGARIYNVNDARGTFTCFAIKVATQHQLYGVTARHCLPDGGYCYLGDWNDSNRLTIGGPAEHAARIDAACFQIENSFKGALTRSNFLPIGYSVDIIDVWDPAKIRGKANSAADAKAEAAIKAKLMPVQHFGATTLVAPGVGIAGQLAKWTPTGSTRVQQTTIARGDSGGPVIDPAKNRWVGFVSSGLDVTTAAGGDVVLLHEALAALGLALGTWQNRGHWL